MLIDCETYLDFIDMGDFSIESIKRISRFLEVPAFIVIEQLTIDGHIKEEDYSEYRKHYNFK